MCRYGTGLANALEYVSYVAVTFNLKRIRIVSRYRFIRGHPRALNVPATVTPEAFFSVPANTSPLACSAPLGLKLNVTGSFWGRLSVDGPKSLALAARTVPFGKATS